MANLLQSRVAKPGLGVLLAAAALVGVACQTTPSGEGSASQPAAAPVVVVPPLLPGHTETLYFEAGIGALSASQLETLRTLAARLAPDPALRVHVVGYSDSTSQETADPWLSEKRAKNVAAYLASQSLDVSRVTIEGAGQSEGPPDTARRAVITLR